MFFQIIIIIYKIIVITIKHFLDITGYRKASWRVLTLLFMLFYLFLFHFVFGNFFEINCNNNNNNKKRIPTVQWRPRSPVEPYICHIRAPQLTASLCQPRRSLKDSLVPIDSCSLNILRHSAGTYVSSVIYWTGVCAEHMNDNQGLCASIEVQQDLQPVMLPQGEIRRGSRALCVTSTVTAPIRGWAKPHWDLKSCYTVS